MKLSDFIFHVDDRYGYVAVMINPATQVTPLRDYYEDEELNTLQSLFKKYDMGEVGTAVFQFGDPTISVEQAKQMMLNEGLKENQEFSRFLLDCTC